LFVVRKEPTKIAPSGKCYVVTDILKLAKIQVPKSQTHHRKEYFFVRNIVLRPLYYLKYPDVSPNREKLYQFRQKIMRRSFKTLRQIIRSSSPQCPICANCQDAGRKQGRTIAIIWYVRYLIGTIITREIPIMY
jgi:hypothetical protein